MSDTSIAFCDGVQSSFDFFSSAAPSRRSAEEHEPAPRKAQPRPEVEIDLTPEPPFSIAADHLRAQKKSR